MLPYLLQSLPQRIQRAQAGIEAQCLRGGIRQVVFEWKTARHTRSSTGTFNCRMGRSGPSERAAVTAISHPCQSVKPAADTIYSWRPSIGNAVASGRLSKVKHFETPLMLGAVQWLLNSHRRQ